jgi:hypothetical protein
MIYKKITQKGIKPKHFDKTRQHNTIKNIQITLYQIKFNVRCCIYLTTYDWIKSFLKITIELRRQSQQQRGR